MRKRKHNRARVLVISDLHANSTVAPWPADCPVQDGGRYEPNPFQAYLNECWADLVEAAGRMGGPTLVINGDLINGIHPRDGQVVSANASIQAAAADMLLRPLVAQCGKLYITRGTEWHESKLSDDVERLAKGLGAVPNPASGSYTWPKLLLEVGGKVISFAHHIGVSGVATYEASVVLRELLMEVLEYTRTYGQDAPALRLMVRSHRHRSIEIGAPPNLRALITPGWQLKTAYVDAKAVNSMPHIGYTVVDDAGEDFAITRRLYPLPLPHVEVA